MYHPLQDYLTAPEVPKPGAMITPVKTIPKTADTWVTRSGRKMSNRDVFVMNSTAQNTEENSPTLPCELSSINATAEVAPQDRVDLMLKKCTDTPAKIFARMKAKVQRQNSTGDRAACGHVRNTEICDSIPSNPVIQTSPNSDTSHGTYVLTISPPQLQSRDAPAGDTDLQQESQSSTVSGRQHEIYTTDSQSFIEPFVLLEKMPREILEMKARRNQMPENPYNRNRQPCVLLDKVVPDETLTQRQQKNITYISGLKAIRKRGGSVFFGEKSIAEETYEEALQTDAPNSPESDPFDQSEPQSESTEVLPGPTLAPPNLLEDPVLLLSPRVLIPRKQLSALQSKRQDRRADLDLHEGSNIRGIHLKDWVLKLLNKDLVVDGIRIDSMIPWHSSFIVERVSSNVLKTASGSTYVLIGKMAKHPKSVFPSWFLKKFLFGFPKMWKEYLDQVLSCHTESQNSRNHNSNAVKSTPKDTNQQVSKNSTSKHPKIQDVLTSPITPADCIQQDSAKVSRSGRLIKPPLEYWKGGRIIMDSDMNVTIHENYCTSVLFTPKKDVTMATSQIPVEQTFRCKTLQKGRSKTSSSEDELSVPMRRIKQPSKPQRKIPSPSSSHPVEGTTMNKPPRAQKGALAEAPHATKQNTSRPQRASLRKQLSGKETTVGSGSEIIKNTHTDAVNYNFSPGDGGDSCDQQETGFKNDPKTKRHSKPSRKRVQEELRSELQNNTTLRRSSRICSKSLCSTDSSSSFASPDPPNTRRGKGSADHKQLTKPHKAMTSVPQDSSIQKEQNKQKSLRGSCRPKDTLERKSDAVSAGDSLAIPTDDEEEKRQHNKKTTLLLKRTRQKEVKSKRKSNRRQVSSEDMHSEHSEDEDSASNHRRSKKSETGKANTQSKKPQTENSKMNKQDEPLDGKWTQEEQQKLHEAVNSLPKHHNGYWAHVAYSVGTRSAEECQEQYNAHQKTNKRSRKRAMKQPAATEEPEKEVVHITAKAGTLKRRQQMRQFLDHMPKDDHDDVFASSPMHKKKIKLPIFSANGDDEDFGQLPNPQTPSSSISTSAKTPQCLHISPGMLGSINKNNMDKYIFHLQKNKKGRKHGKKAGAMDKLTPPPAVKKAVKRCVAEDDDFVVWNMHSDKDFPSRDDDSEEEDDYLMECC